LYTKRGELFLEEAHALPIGRGNPLDHYKDFKNN